MSPTLKSIFGLGLVLILLAGIFFAAVVVVIVPSLQSYLGGAEEVAPAKYTTGLKALFDVYDKSSSSLVTSDLSILFYSTGISPDPFGYTFVSGDEITTAIYDSVKGQWKAVLDEGDYLVLVKDIAASPTKYPELITISVPGTDESNKEVSPDPSMLKLVERGSVTISKSISAYNSASGAYDISVTNINITTYDKWLVTFSFVVGGTNKEIKPGRIYLSKITNLQPTKAYIDGSKVSIVEDTDASDDGMTGYYVEFSGTWKGGEKHTLDVYFKENGTASTGTITLTLFDYYACLNSDLRWWTPETTTVSVVS